MEVNKVEFGRAPRDEFDHHHVQGVSVIDPGEAQRARTHCLKLRRRNRIAAGEQRHLMSLADKALRQPGNDALRTAV